MNSFRWRLTLTYLAIAAVSIAAIGSYLLNWTEKYYTDSVRKQLRADSVLLVRIVSDDMGKGVDPDRLDRLAKTLGRTLNLRITIVNLPGVVLADSDYDPRLMENHRNRPEIRRALAAGFGTSVRASRTLHTTMLYDAAAVPNAIAPRAVVRVAMPLLGLAGLLDRIRNVFLVAMGLTLVLVALISLRVTGQIVAPISEMTAMARRIAGGEFSRRLRVRKGPEDEVFVLMGALNEMAERIEHLVLQLSREKSKVETVLRKTDDGIVVLDDHGQIQSVNPAAEMLFGFAESELVGKSVMEGLLHTELSQLAARTLSSGETGSLDVTVTSPKERLLSAHCAPITGSSDPDARPDGVALTLHDLTELKRISRVRRDFVANVSHELRTPLSTLRAMAETVALRFEDNTEAAAEFSTKIVGEVQRLTAIVDELLELAEIEEGKRGLNTRRIRVVELVERAVNACAADAARKQIGLDVSVDEDLELEVDPDAICQVVVNLVQNGINYTDTGGKVTISAQKSEGPALISVADTGIGISKADRERIFERFYRVDKARSRETGGTGLGLSIAKHLVELHGGSLSVESEPGKGSVFTISLPR
ncbi:MAG: ATP-binding protein [Armatimonadota bacterium]|nr:ATP-binding protein [Armatimonadota bacterium]